MTSSTEERVYKTPLSKRRASAKYQAKRRKDPAFREQQAAYLRKYVKENRAVLTVKSREYQKKNAVWINLRRLGLDKKHEELVKKHHGLCDICGGPPDGRWKRLCIDHCHKTGRFRGLLCFKCNRAIGYFKDSPKLLRKAAAYLEKEQ